jgi:ubiquinone/menaquinone biosynthesis C-methylase UbiE/uncharacterized protein YbaR (Trm112 family)
MKGTSFKGYIFGKLIPRLTRLLGAVEGSWESEKYYTFIVACCGIPIKRLRRFRRSPALVESQYDKIAGAYIQDNYYSAKMRYAVVDGEVKKISSIDNMLNIRREMRQVLSELEFNNVLEVGVGELTTLEDVYSAFGPALDCYGVDLSLNRVVHGIREYSTKHDLLPNVAKANALKLPFADNSFDLVITRHTLEQMPTIYKEVIDEIARVSRHHIVFFEPSFTMGSLTQKLKMLNNDYVRGIFGHVSRLEGFVASKRVLMDNSANPLNHTACYRAVSKHPPKGSSTTGEVPFVCPITLSELKHKGNYLYSEAASRAYPIIEDVPVLDPAYSLTLTDCDN